MNHALTAYDICNLFYDLNTTGSDLKKKGTFIRETIKRLQSGQNKDEIIKEYEHRTSKENLIPCNPDMVGGVHGPNLHISD